MTHQYAASPVVNRMFDEMRHYMFGDKLLTEDRAAKVEAAFTAGMKRPAIALLVSDPYWGIPSKGRTGAAANLADQMAARPARRARNPGQPVGRVFKSDTRHKRFVAYIREGVPRNTALKFARRVSVDA